MEPKGASLAAVGLGTCKVEPSMAVACPGSAAPASKRRRVEAMADRRHHRRINDHRRSLCPKSERWKGRPSRWTRSAGRDGVA